MDDPKILPSKDMEEHHQRVKACYDFHHLEDGDRIMMVLPAFDFRGGPDEKYGQHWAELIFAKRKGPAVVTATFFTGWPVSSVTGENDIIHRLRDGSLMCTGLYMHFKLKKDAVAAGWSSPYSNDGCPFWGDKKCYGDLGSSLYGDVVLKRLILEGSAGVWAEIDQALDEANGNV